MLATEDVPGLVLEILKQVHSLRKEVEKSNALNEIFAARLSDRTHLTIKEAAEYLKRTTGKGSVAAVNRRLAAGTYTLEKKTGMREGGIPVEQLVGADWLPYRAYRTAMRRQSEEDAKSAGKK